VFANSRIYACLFAGKSQPIIGDGDGGSSLPARSQFCRKLRRGRMRKWGGLRAGVKLASSPFIELADGCAF